MIDARIDLLFTMSDSMPPHCLAARRARNLCFLSDEFRTPGWWSQTGSNRRPPACKAGALPTELWPLRGRKTDDGGRTSVVRHSVFCRPIMVGLDRLERSTSP